MNKKNSVLDEDNVMPHTDNLSYEVRSCADLYRMYKSNQLEIQPDFQRNFVWKPITQTIFVDSLCKGLPIPSIFISLDSSTGRRIVIDGLQRISTIVKFFENSKWRLNKSSDIDENISGKSVAVIKQKFPNLYQRVENATIPVITIRSDFTMQGSMDGLFNIFHRLNTGGQKLNNQEIRNCIYSGKFNDMLKKIAKSEQWVNIMGTTNHIDRLEDEEILLRTFVFLDRLDDYTGNLSKFLNHYMLDKKDITDVELEDKRDILTSTLYFLYENIDNRETVSQMGKTVKEALLVGVSKNIVSISAKTKEEFRIIFERFLNDDCFKDENLKQGLSKKDKVQSRLKQSISIFSV